MEAVVRAMQVGVEAGSASVVILSDDVQSIGSGPIYRKLLELVLRAVGDGRWPQHAIAVAALEVPPAAYQQIFSLAKGPSVSIIDCWSNAYGWNKPVSQQQSVHGPPLALFEAASKTDSNRLDELEQRLVGNTNSQKIIFIDSLSPLIDVFGVAAVSALMTRLRKHCSSLVCGIHEDVHSQHEVSMLCYDVTCLAQVGPARERPGLPQQPHGRVSMKTKRKSGAVKSDGFDYRILGPSHEVEVLSPVASTPPLAAPAAAPAAKGEAGVAALGQQLAGGMRLEVTPEEAAARREVQLPYEHQGQGQLYAAGGDFRDYLPEAAGGRRRGEGRLGHILYVRDSDDEEPDSDEDPDDDLDI